MMRRVCRARKRGRKDQDLAKKKKKREKVHARIKRLIARAHVCMCQVKVIEDCNDRFIIADRVIAAVLLSKYQ